MERTGKFDTERIHHTDTISKRQESNSKLVSFPSLPAHHAARALLAAGNLHSPPFYV
jgi:hypothetical protein